MKRLLALLVLLPAPAFATAFRLPLADCDQPTKCVDSNKCYATAYFDHQGKDWNCGTVTYSGHLGSDFGVQNTYGVRPVVAAAKGTVLEINDGCPVGQWGSTCGGGFGNYVKLSHEDGKITIYGHMQMGTLKVTPNQKVTCGQELGRAGSSGNSTGPHTHFEVVTTEYGSDDPFAGNCGGPLSYWVSQGGYCLLPGAGCEETCVKQCSGKVCGPDGCGSTCGDCGDGQSCGTDGKCSTSPVDDAEFIKETIPDFTRFDPGTAFTKDWILANRGSAPWTKAAGYAFVYNRDDDFGAPHATYPSPTDSIAPGQQKTWSVQMIAPQSEGTHTGYWQMVHNGTPFGPEVWVTIEVNAPPASVDGVQYVAETIPDDTYFSGGAAFTKTWTALNTGTSTWSDADAYAWEYDSGDVLSATSPVSLGPTETIAPNASKVWSVPMVAPAAPGTYRGYWHLTHRGIEFGGEVWVEIIVKAPMPNDKDGDGHYDINSPGGDDCDDNDPDIYPGHPEICDGKDNDCNGKTDEDIPDQDCGLGACATTVPGCVNGKVPLCVPKGRKNETCNGLDDDCDGVTDNGAICSGGQVCALGRCVEPRVDAGTPAAPDTGSPQPGLDASSFMPDTGSFTPFNGGGCGCSASGAPALLAAAAVILAGLRRKRR